MWLIGSNWRCFSNDGGHIEEQIMIIRFFLLFFGHSLDPCSVADLFLLSDSFLSQTFTLHFTLLFVEIKNFLKLEIPCIWSIFHYAWPDLNRSLISLPAKSQTSYNSTWNFLNLSNIQKLLYKTYKSVPNPPPPAGGIWRCARTGLRWQNEPLAMQTQIRFSLTLYIEN